MARHCAAESGRALCLLQGMAVWMELKLNIIRVLVVALVLLPLAGLLAADLATTEAARAQAVEAGAPELAARDFARAEKTLQAARRDAERNKPARSAERAAEATVLYQRAELDAITATVLADAWRELDAAREARAERFAPATLAQAEQFAADAEAALAAERYEAEPAQSLAAAAAAVARQAREIATLARSKPAIETLVLEHSNNLRRLQLAAGLEPEPGQLRNSSVDDLENALIELRRNEDRLSRELSESRAFMAALEEEIRILDKQLGGAQSERRQLVIELEEQARRREQFALAEGMFAPAEAVVLRQDDSIIVRLTGLNFASGSAALPENGLPLLDKLERAIALYPDALLMVEGHTDAQGSDRLNQRLSQNRAQAVLNHLVEALRIPPQRIRAVGYGESRPIANNETSEGRAQNRRIDLVITP